MLTWISDIPFKLYDQVVEAPMITEDGLYVEYYHETPLYHHLIKHEIIINKSKPEAINNFNQFINSDYKIVTFTCNIMNEEELLWVKRLLSIMLYKLNYNIYNIDHLMENDYIRLIPSVQIDVFNSLPIIENIYTKNTIDIDVNELIGYKPLIDLYEHTIALSVAASDLIWACDLEPYKYEIINDVPVIKLKHFKHMKARYTEFSMNPLLSLQSNVIDLSKNTFSYEPININYGFKVIEQYNHYFLQHDVFDKAWVDSNIKRIKNNKLPLATITGDWHYEPTVKNVVFMKYLAIRAYVDLFKDIKDINDIKVGFDLSIQIPITSYDDIELLKNKISLLLLKNKPYLFIGDKNEVINQYQSLDVNNVFLGFPFYDEWVLVGNTPIKTNKINKSKKSIKIANDIIGLDNLYINPRV